MSDNADNNQSKRSSEYDRESTGWDFVLGQEDEIRPEEERERCGMYEYKDSGKSWGDHRVAFRGTTCVEVDCHVNHHPTVLPGWSEPQEDYYDRPGVHAIAAVFDGWDSGGLLIQGIGSTTAWVVGHVALDALRDAGYIIVKTDDNDELSATE